MIPKVRAAMACLHGDVQEVVIVDGSVPRVLSRAVNEGGIGTRIVRDVMHISMRRNVSGE